MTQNPVPDLPAVPGGGGEDVRQEPNTVFWARVRDRAQLRWRQVLPESAKTGFIGLMLFGWMLIVMNNSRALSFPFTAAPISGTNIIAIGALLAALMSGLWVAVVTSIAAGDPSASAPPVETVLVRLQVLAVSVRALSVATACMAAAAAAWYSGLPDGLDLARTLPIVGGWVFIAVIGADAATLATDPEGGGLNRFRKVTPLLRTERALRELGVHPDRHTPRTLLRELLTLRQLLPLLGALFLAPCIAAASTALINPPTSDQIVGRFVLACCFSVAAFLGWVLLSSLIINRQLLDAGVVATLTSMFVVLIVVSVAESASQQQADATWPYLARIMLSVTLVAAPPMFLHGIGAIPARAPRADGPSRNAVLTVVAALLLRRHRRQLQTLQPPTAVQIDRLAIVAGVLLPIPPVALILANASAARLRSDHSVRGRRLAVTVRWVAAALLAAPVGALLVTAVVA